MSKRDYLSLERTPRPEEIQEDPPEQIEKVEHAAFIARLGAQAKRMEFAVGTAILRGATCRARQRHEPIRPLSPSGQNLR